MTEQPKDIVLSNNDMHPAEEIAHLKDLLGKANALARIRAERIKELEAQAGAEPDWSHSTTLPLEGWKNRMYSLAERLEMADGAVSFEREVNKNLRAQLADAEPVSLRWLVEMIMSDCGHSTNNTRLVERLTARIERYERANTAHPPARVPLTDEEIDKLPWGPHEGNPLTFAEGLRDFAHTIIAAYEAKNGIGGGK